jgi:hypothetical protein
MIQERWPVKRWIDNATQVWIGWVHGMGDGMPATLTSTSQTGVTLVADGREYFVPWTSLLWISAEEV